MKIIAFDSVICDRMWQSAMLPMSSCAVTELMHVQLSTVIAGVLWRCALHHACVYAELLHFSWSIWPTCRCVMPRLEWTARTWRLSGLRTFWSMSVHDCFITFLVVIRQYVCYFAGRFLKSYTLLHYVSYFGFCSFVAVALMELWWMHFEQLVFLKPRLKVNILLSVHVFMSCMAWDQVWPLLTVILWMSCTEIACFV